MKTLRIILSALAILGASGATLATQHFSPQMQTYIYLPPQGQDPAECQQVQVDCGGNGALCTYNKKPVRDKDDITSFCGEQLRFNSIN